LTLRLRTAANCTPPDIVNDATVAALRAQALEVSRHEADTQHQAVVASFSAEEHRMQSEMWQKRYLQERKAREMAIDRLNVSFVSFLCWSLPMYSSGTPGVTRGDHIYRWP
jgi:hypothetical protein